MAYDALERKLCVISAFSWFEQKNLNVISITVQMTHRSEGMCTTMKNIIATESQNGPEEQGFTEQLEGYL